MKVLLLVIAAIAALAAASVVVFVISPRLDPLVEKQRIEREFGPLLRWLGEEYSRSGVYPQNLPDQYGRQLKGDKLSGKYISDGKNCLLAFGHYLFDGFTIFWASNDGAWRIDG